MRKKIAFCDWLGSVPVVFRAFFYLGAFVVIFPLAAKAQTAREYLNIPIDELSGFMEYTFTRAESAASAGLSAPNDLTFSRLTVPLLLYSFPWRKKYAGIQVATPFVRVTGPGGTMTTAGFADPAISFHTNLYGLKALKRSELAQYVPKTIVSFHMTVNVPLGKYNKNSPLNVGSNRWAFTPLVNLNIPRKKGREWFEFYVSARFFTNNNEFQVNRKLSQRPLLTLTGHYSHNIGKKMWASYGGNYDIGGRTSIDGVRQDNYVNGFRPQATISRLFFNRVGVSLRYENTKTSERQSDRNSSLSIRVGSYLWTRKP